jgi:hypothetical protein
VSAAWRSANTSSGCRAASARSVSVTAAKKRKRPASSAASGSDNVRPASGIRLNPGARTAAHRRRASLAPRGCSRRRLSRDSRSRLLAGPCPCPPCRRARTGARVPPVHPPVPRRAAPARRRGLRVAAPPAGPAALRRSSKLALAAAAPRRADARRRTPRGREPAAVTEDRKEQQDDPEALQAQATGSRSSDRGLRSPRRARRGRLAFVVRRRWRASGELRDRRRQAIADAYRQPSAAISERSLGVPGPNPSSAPLVASSTSGGFDWQDAGIGASAVFGVALVLLTVVALGRRHRSGLDQAPLSSA